MLARRVAIFEVEMAAPALPDARATRVPVGFDRVVIRHRGAVVVGGIEPGAIHSAVNCELHLWGVASDGGPLCAQASGGPRLSAMRGAMRHDRISDVLHQCGKAL